MNSKATTTHALYTKLVSVDDALKLEANFPKETLIFLCEECGCKMTPRDEHFANGDSISPARFEHYPFEEGQKKCSKRSKRENRPSEITPSA